MAEEKIPVIAVVGPTASGKSALAVQLAKWLHTEIVSADSMQIYREMAIGTARPTAAEMDGVVHHLVGFLPMEQPFSVADYVAAAGKCLREIAARGKIPILAGGTGLYLRSLLENLDFSEGEKDESLRASLREKAEREGAQSLVEELRQFDPSSAERIEPNNVPRLIRAIELYRTTGKTMTQLLAESRKHPSPYRACKLGLNYRDRAVLYGRIDRRVDRMVADGLLEEAAAVLHAPEGGTALQAIGYKELRPYLEGREDLETAVEAMKRSTRRYAKRQLTWFRREEDIHWLYPDDYAGPESLLAAAKTVVQTYFSKEGNLHP